PRFLHNGNRPCKKRFDALHMQGTWSLVHIAGNKNIVGSKWIYKIKRNSYGSIARHKARQEQGLDFSETFSPVVRHTTIRLILSLAAMNKWHLRQLDVKNAFLHGELEEEVFMRQPQGFADPGYPDFVCKHKKTLYGLKQAPRAWNAKFTGYLLAIDSEVVILLLYSDDIILIGSNEKMVHLVIDELSSVFEMKDLVSYVSNGDIFVNQSKYAKELLHKAGMTSCRSCSTPCKPHTHVLKDYGEVLTDPTLMNQPTNLHWHLVKRILRYVQGTLEYGLSFTASDMHLSTYSDADWVGDINTRRSTTGFVIFLGSNPISWQSKKQGSVSRSSTEAEYMTLANTTTDLAWI
ncbi:wall associated kinase-like 1, partial [Prunus dulcis]